MVNFWEDVLDNDNFRLDAVNLEALPANLPGDLQLKSITSNGCRHHVSDESWEYEFMFVRDHKNPRVPSAVGAFRTTALGTNLHASSRRDERMSVTGANEGENNAI